MGFLSLATVRQGPPLALVSNCGECGLLKRCQSPKMAVSGQGKRKLLIVAPSPSETADAKGRPFLDSGHTLLAETLAASGIDLKRDCWLTYSQACHGFSKGATQHCRPLLLSRVKGLQPVVVLLLGIEPVSSVIGHLWKPSIGKEIERWVGWTVPARPWDAWVCPTFDPTDVEKEYNPAYKLWFRKHVAAAVAKLKARPFDGQPPPDYDARCQVITDDESANRAMGDLPSEAATGNSPVAWDLETNCLKPDNPEAAIACCSLATNGRAIAYPWTKVMADATKGFLESNFRKIGANMKFEDRWARKVIGCRVKNWWHDVVLAAHLLNNAKAVTSVKFQAFVHLGVPEYDAAAKQYLHADAGGYATNRVFRCDWPTLLKYCAMDALVEYEVAKVQRKLMYPKPEIRPR